MTTEEYMEQLHKGAGMFQQTGYLQGTPANKPVMTSPEAAPTVQQRQEGLDVSLSILSDRIGHLENRLVTVSMPIPPTGKDATGAPTPMMSPLAARVMASTLTVQALTSRVEALLANLEV